MAIGLGQAGAKVIITGRNPEKNKKMLSILGQAEAVVTLDVRDEPAVEQTMAHIVKHFGHLDILVNNAGLFRGGSVMDLSQDDWNAVIGTHLTGSFLCAKHATRLMISGKKAAK